MTRPFIQLLLVFLLLQNVCNSTEKPIPVIFPILENMNISRSYGFGHINAVSGWAYPMVAIQGNPAILGNRNFNRGIMSSGPIVTKNLIMGDLNLIYSDHPKNFFGFHSDYFWYYYDVSNSSPLITISSNYIFSTALNSLTYSRYINEHWSWGSTIKYLKYTMKSGLINKSPAANTQFNIFAFDYGIRYARQLKYLEGKLSYESGLFISNIGKRIDSITHILYPKSFLPTTMHFGNLIKYRSQSFYKSVLDVYVAYQVDKLLVPSVPEVEDFNNGNFQIVQGKSPDVSAAKGMFQSFFDAPGGFSEEMHELIHKAAIEWRLTYDNKLQLALRFGGVMQNSNKGDNNFFTVGLRAGYKGFFIDISELPGYPVEYIRFNLGYVTKIPEFKFRFVI